MIWLVVNVSILWNNNESPDKKSKIRKVGRIASHHPYSLDLNICKLSFILFTEILSCKTFKKGQEKINSA